MTTPSPLPAPLSVARPAKLTRRADWPVRLARFLAAHEGRAFQFGTHDCSLFAADWVREATGWDPAAAFRGCYDSRRSARRALHAYGAGPLRDTVTAILGSPRRGVLYGQRGDVALIRAGDRHALGIVTGGEVMGAGRAGLVRVPLAMALKVWAI